MYEAHITPTLSIMDKNTRNTLLDQVITQRPGVALFAGDHTTVHIQLAAGHTHHIAIEQYRNLTSRSPVESWGITLPRQARYAGTFVFLVAHNADAPEPEKGWNYDVYVIEHEALNERIVWYNTAITSDNDRIVNLINIEQLHCYGTVNLNLPGYRPTRKRHPRK